MDSGRNFMQFGASFVSGARTATHFVPKTLLRKKSFEVSLNFARDVDMKARHLTLTAPSAESSPTGEALMEKAEGLSGGGCSTQAASSGPITPLEVHENNIEVLCASTAMGTNGDKRPYVEV